MVNLDGLATYVSWPSDSSVSCFMYTDMQDQVACRLCGLIINDWRQRNVNPLSEHRLRSPHCSFSAESSTPGPSQPIESSLSSSLHQDSSSMEQSTSNSAPVIDSDVQPTVTARDPETGARPGIDREVAMDDVIHFTFGDPISPTPCAATGISFPAADKCVNLVQEPAAGCSERQTLFGYSAEQQTTRNTRTVIHTPRIGDEMSVEEQTSGLHDAKTCKLCMDKQVNSVFIPCGHLVSCDQCSPGLRICPTCRTDIHGIVSSKQFSHKLNELLTSIMT